MRHLRLSGPLVAVTLLVAACGDPPCPAGSMRTPEGRCIAIADAGDGGARDGDAMDDGAPPMDTGPGCVPSDVPDPPDPMHVDSNCDGIDGDLALSVFVSTTGDDANEGTSPDAPVETIGRGLEIATTLGRSDVLVASGSYDEVVTLVDGVSIHGGYADGTWARAGEPSRVFGPGPVITGSMVSSIVLSELNVAADDAPAGESSVAIRFLDVGGITLEDTAVSAGSGGNGAPGTTPTDVARDGQAGGAGGRSALPTASCSFTPYTPARGAAGPASCGCGAGGLGGTSRTALTEAPVDGDQGASCGAATGGMGAMSRDMEFIGGAGGDPGDVGADGPDGGGGDAIGAFDPMDGSYVPAPGRDGGDGLPGGGGGGGGAGGYCITTSSPAGCFLRGGSGGGGGSGGCGGAPGSGGVGGGASVAIVAARTDMTLRSVTLTTSRGGNGGRGGDGQPGGNGGPGGEGGLTRTAGGCTSGPGGPGGDGGDGGPGGAGGGGGGGPSIGVALLDGSTVDAASSYTTMLGGGGSGGVAGADGDGEGGNAGSEGLSTETYEAP